MAHSPQTPACEITCADLDCRVLAKRGGRPQDGDVSRPASVSEGVLKTAKTAIVALAAVKARILDHVPETALEEQPLHKRPPSCPHPSLECPTDADNDGHHVVELEARDQ